MKKSLAFTSILLSLLLAGSGCSSQSGTSSSGGATPSLGAAQDPEKPNGEPITLKVMSFSVNPNGTGPMDNAVAKHMEKELGITIDMIPTNEQDCQNQLPALIASNDLLDVFFIPETDTLKYIDMMHKGGQILALDDYLAEHAPNMMADPPGPGQH